MAVDSDQQVYVIGQIGMSPAGAAAPAPALFGTGAPNRLALEIERITPYANTPGGGFQPNFCPGPVNAPCAFPELLFPDPITQTTSSFLVDAAAGTRCARFQ